MQSPLLTVPGACDYMHVSRWTLWRLRKRGEIETISVGRRVLIPKDALDAYLEEMRTGGRRGQ